MKIGVCGGSKDAKTIKKHGYDYVEENFSVISSMTDAEFEKALSTYSDIGISVYSTNGFFPAGFEIYGEKNAGRALAYAESGLRRAAKLGVKIVIIGSGGQRRIPDNADRSAYEAEFVSLVGKIADEAGKYGISIAVEPLKYAETNFINTVADGVRICEKTGRKNVGTMVDFHHFSQNGESGDELIAAGEKLIHAHLARPNDDRLIPTDISDLPTIKKWAAMLAAADYKGNISLEGFFGENYEYTLGAAMGLLAPLAEYGG